MASRSSEDKDHRRGRLFPAEGREQGDDGAEGADHGGCSEDVFGHGSRILVTMKSIWQLDPLRVCARTPLMDRT